MNGITVPMALVDFIPVLLFFAAAVLLQRDLYRQMVKGAYARLATGSIMVLIGGLFKATWKILYALRICDYPLLSDSFFPMQGPGFLLVFLALVGMFTPWNRKGTTTLLGVGWCRCTPAPSPLSSCRRWAAPGPSGPCLSSPSR